MEEYTVGLSECADAIQLVECFRRRGVVSSKLHALIPKLQQLARGHGFLAFMDFKEDTEAEAASLTLSCDHFMIDLMIHAAASLDQAISTLSLVQDEKGSPWAHAPTETLKSELIGCLRNADVAGFFRRLTSLSESQELMSRAGADKAVLSSQWSDTATALEQALGVPAVRCCEGLRFTYYDPPGHEVTSSKCRALLPPCLLRPWP